MLRFDPDLWPIIDPCSFSFRSNSVFSSGGRRKQVSSNPNGVDPGLPSKDNKPEAPYNFEPDSLDSDKCIVKLDIGRATAFLYGTLIRTFMHLKENLFGEDQKFTQMDISGIPPEMMKAASKEKEKSKAATTVPYSGSSEREAKFDPRLYRPIDVILDISIRNLQAHLIKNCSINDQPCPFAMVERIAFEMDKR